MKKFSGFKAFTAKAGQAFGRDDNGQLTMTFALAAVPFMMAATLAFDMSNMNHMKGALRNAADAAALAAATALATGQSDADKTTIANQMFYYNITDDLRAGMKATPHTVIDFEARTVNVSVEVEVDERFSSYFADHVDVNVTSQAVVDPGDPICLMALSKSASNAIHVQGTADVEASDCALHTNSSAPDALSQNGSSQLTADTICVTGGYTGSNYSPSPKTGCMVEEDPLAATFATALAATDTTSCKAGFTGQQLKTDMVLDEGVYCGGLYFKQGTYTLNPGVYVIRDGMFNVRAGATVNGTGVTILMVGNANTRMDTQGGANLNISAPSSGPFSGIAIAQAPSSVPTQENVITGGGDMNISGIVYLPKQPLLITGNGTIGQNAQQFAVIADTISVQGTGLLNIKVGSDPVAAGLPPLPEANEVVRLSR